MCKLLVSTNFNCTAEITFFYKLLNTTSALCVQIKSFRNKDHIKYTRKRPDKIKCSLVYSNGNRVNVLSRQLTQSYDTGRP